jgi:hypothetical protein
MARHGRPPKGTWISSSKMAEVLGVSPTYLHRQKGVILKLGEHWRNISPKAQRPTYRFHRENVEQAFRTYWNGQAK